MLLHDTRARTAQDVAARLVEAVAVPVRVGSWGRTSRRKRRGGLARHASGVEELVQHADVAMYAAKANGKNQVQVFSDGLLRTDSPIPLGRQPGEATTVAARPASPVEFVSLDPRRGT